MKNKLIKLSPKENSKVERPKNPCANCWGFQESGDPKWNPLDNKQMDVNNHIKKKSIINEFLKTYLNTPHIFSL